jgi:hypothetical protein
MAPKSKKPDPKSQPKTTPKTPNWPPLRPLLPAADLTLTPLLTDQIYLIRNFLSGTLCKTYASFLASLPLTTTPGTPKKDEALRVNDRFQIDDARFAEMLWSTTALKELVTTRFEDESDGSKDEDSLAERARQLWGGEPLGLNPNIRIYRYSAGQFFGQHCKSSLDKQAFGCKCFHTRKLIQSQTTIPITSPSPHQTRARKQPPHAQPGHSLST